MCVNPEIEALLHIIKGDDFVMPVLCDIRQLIRLAMRHKVIYPLLLFARNHSDRFTQEQLSQLEARSKSIALRSLIQLNELKTIAGVLNDHGIAFIVVKGPHLARIIYGHNATKESVDLDIMLVHERDHEKVHVLLTQAGYSVTNYPHSKTRLQRKLFFTAKREISYFAPGKRCAVDLHIRPGANTYLTTGYFSGFFTGLREDMLDGTSLPVLADEPYLVYLCYHASLHQFSRLAWLLDIRAFLLIRQQNLDFAMVLRFARQINAERSVYLAMILLKAYFGEEIPLLLQNHNRLLQTHSLRMKFLAGICRHLLCREEGYWQSIQERFVRFFYIMALIKSFKAKTDWILAMLMRKLIRFS
jgi:hypothetical protein